MNRKKLLLDCTLRDGGYLNDWKFGYDNIAYIFDREAASGVDFIEVGFLDERREYDPERTIQPDTACFDRIFGGFGKGRSKVVAMIDFGTCGITHLSRCEDSWLDGIRVIFKKDKMVPALAFCEEIKKLGYLVFVQAVSITSYNDDELRELIALVNHCEPYAVSMVDTYGLLDSTGLDHIIGVIDRELKDGIALGYHAHNNFQLGYANAVSVLNTDTERTILVDGSLYGMGKSAGNAPIELLAMYMNRHFDKGFDVLQMQEAISSAIMDIYMKKPWGYTLFFYIAASNRCHPDYVSWLMNKRTLSVSAINEILKSIPEEEKLNKNMKLLESLYLDYQRRECGKEEGPEALKEAFLGERPVLVLGPGRNLYAEEERVQGFISGKKPVIISINQLPVSYHTDYLFLTNSRRYNRLVRALRQTDAKVIATSNVRSVGAAFDYTVNYGALIDEKAEFPDNSLLMLLTLLRRTGLREVYLAGFDGYTPYDINYYDGKMAYDFVREKAEVLNKQVRDFLAANEDELSVHFVTGSVYGD